MCHLRLLAIFLLSAASSSALSQQEVTYDSSGVADYYFTGIGTLGFKRDPISFTGQARVDIIDTPLNLISGPIGSQYVPWQTYFYESQLFSSFSYSLSGPGVSYSSSPPEAFSFISSGISAFPAGTYPDQPGSLYFMSSSYTSLATGADHVATFILPSWDTSGLPTGGTAIEGNPGYNGYIATFSSTGSVLSSFSFGLTSFEQVALPVKYIGDGFAFVLPVDPVHDYLIDPPYASGYKYATGAGNPNFNSVSFPELQSAPYDLSFESGGKTITDSLSPGVTFTFPAGGVGAFTVTGILPSDDVNPQSPIGFATTVSFVASGEFTGTQIPIVGAVPEPSTYAAMLIGLGMLGLVSLRRSKIVHASAAAMFAQEQRNTLI